MADTLGQFDAENEATPQSPVRYQEMVATATQHLEQARKFAQAGNPGMAERELRQANASLPRDMRIDEQTGQMRDATFWEQHGDTIKFLALAGASVVGGIYLSALNGAAPAAAGGSESATAALYGGTRAAGADVISAAGSAPLAATASGAYGPMAGGYAGLDTVGATTATGAAGAGPWASGYVGAAGSGAPAWMNSALWRVGTNVGTNVLSTALDNRGRQQAADTLKDAADRAGAYSQQQNQAALAFARQMQGNTQGSLQFPGYYAQGQTTPSFAQMMNGQPSAGPRMNIPAPQGRMLDGPQGGMPPNFAQMMNGSGSPPMVTVRAPTGETRTVPADQAQRYLAAGAARVN